MTEHEHLLPWDDPNATETGLDPERASANKIKYIIDDWINFALDADTAYAIFHLRQKLNTLVLNFVSNPRYYNLSSNDNHLLCAVAKLLESEDEANKFPHHMDIGMRPRPMMNNTSQNRSFEVNYDNRNQKQSNRKYGYNKGYNNSGSNGASNGENIVYK
jgi:hypothetical protein